MDVKFFPDEIYQFNYHFIYGNWRLHTHPDKDLTLKIADAAEYISDTVVIPLHDIAWKGKHFYPFQSGKDCFCCGGHRYRKASIDDIAIVMEGCSNPYGNRYLMLDGRHRIQKMLDAGMNFYNFYLIRYDDVKHLL